MLKIFFRYIPSILLLLSGSVVSSQSNWQSVVLASDTWKYLPAVSEPPSDWNTLSFDDDNLAGRAGRDWL